MALGDFLRSFVGLGNPTNKVRDGFLDEREEGVIETPISSLTLEKSDDELLELKNAWLKKWENSETREKVEARQKENEKYWKGEHYTSAQQSTGQKDAVNNLIFEAIETSQATYSRQIAQPVIETSPNENAKRFAKKVEDKIISLADEMRLRLKVRKAVRYWSLYFLGALKIGWSMETDEIAVESVRPQQLILDPDAITDECEYNGYYLGHYRKDTAEDLIARFKEKTNEIKTALSKDKLGTKLRYIEWWTADFVFWTLGNNVLGKSKNPHWNYDTDEDVQIGENELGEPILGKQRLAVKNHFKTRKIPFVFLSVFNLGKFPFDDTNLVEQVLPLQDIVNKRVRQIDKNADNTNGGVVVSGDHFTKEQAAQVGRARRKGETIWVPRGDVNRAFTQVNGPALPSFVYQDLLDSRDQLRGVFGVTGLSAQGIKSEDTVRGKILVKSQDTDRSSPIVDQIEQVYDAIFNWLVQLMMVYYDLPRPVTSSQGDKMISAEEFVWPLTVSVKEGSLIPKDRLTQRNEAIDLWAAKAISAEELFEKLEFPNPKESAKRLLVWQMVQSGQLPPQVLFPDFPITANQAIQQFMAQQQGQMGQPQEQPPPEQTESQQLLGQVPMS